MDLAAHRTNYRPRALWLGKFAHCGLVIWIVHAVMPFIGAMDFKDERMERLLYKLHLPFDNLSIWCIILTMYSISDVPERATFPSAPTPVNQHTILKFNLSSKSSPVQKISTCHHFSTSALITKWYDFICTTEIIGISFHKKFAPSSEMKPSLEWGVLSQLCYSICCHVTQGLTKCFSS